MSNSSIREFADQLSDVYCKLEDIKIEARVLIQCAKEAGINTRVLTKLAREMAMQSDKLKKKLDDEAQLSLFRDEVSLHARKGLSEIPSAKTRTEATVAYLKESRRIREQAAE